VSNQFRRTLALLISVLALAAFSGCIFKKPARDPDQGRQFQSPLPDIQVRNLAYPEVRELLEQRACKTGPLKANMTLTAGGGLAGRQQFQTTMFLKQPNFLRVRGSQESGTVFDVMINRDEVRAVVYPERNFYRGHRYALQTNPMVLGGIDPEVLMQNFAVEQSLVQAMQQYQPDFQVTRDHYVLTFMKPDGATDRYTLRQADLLCDMYERLYNGNLYSNIRFYGYTPVEGRCLLPLQFTVTLPRNNTQFQASVNEVRINEEIPAQAYEVPVPQGFSHMALARY
jgi:hypothetical protein